MNLYKMYIRLANVLPGRICFWLQYFEQEFLSIFRYLKLRNLKFDTTLIDYNKYNFLCFSEHPYTSWILLNGLKISNSINVIFGGKIFKHYADLDSVKRVAGLELPGGANFECYRKLGNHIRKKNKHFFRYVTGATDFWAPIQFFDPNKKNLIYFNHRPFFSCMHYFNVCKIKDRINIINCLKKPNMVLLFANNYDYYYAKYILNCKKEMYYIPPLTNEISFKYSGDMDKILIIPGKDKIWPGREQLIGTCIGFFHEHNQKNIYSITSEYRNKKYEFKEISGYKALIVIPYTIYIGSVEDFLDMGMPMFFPSPKLLAEWHLKYDLLKELDFQNEYINKFGKDIFSNTFLSKLKSSLELPRDIPSPWEKNIYSLEYWIKKADWYSKRPIITFDSFEDLFMKLKKTNLKKYSESLLSFNKRKKLLAYKGWQNILYSLGLTNNPC